MTNRSPRSGIPRGKQGALFSKEATIRAHICLLTREPLLTMLGDAQSGTFPRSRQAGPYKHQSI
ncbi:hypothetical protein FRAHR75_390022 [Frankia sp. Hr75.2]|nr:hypothetical protein FRAHR75_390022 [Frankia sp. Hr75.2]SQD96736.1 hypothetical protein FMEAI12_3740051 [Parafrankia sp. Ea1.12]